jgi:hypothetical protein
LPFSEPKDVRFAPGLTPVGLVRRVAASTGYHSKRPQGRMAAPWPVAWQDGRHALLASQRSASYATGNRLIIGGNHAI